MQGASGATGKYPATFSGGFSLHHGSPGTDIKSERTFSCRAMQARESAGSDRCRRRGGNSKFPSFRFSTLYRVSSHDGLNLFTHLMRCERPVRKVNRCASFQIIAIMSFVNHNVTLRGRVASNSNYDYLRRQSYFS